MFPSTPVPPEMEVAILSYLDIKSLGQSAQVSKQWKIVSEDNGVWRHIAQSLEFFDLVSPSSECSLKEQIKDATLFVRSPYEFRKKLSFIFKDIDLSKSTGIYYSSEDKTAEMVIGFNIKQLDALPQHMDELISMCDIKYAITGKQEGDLKDRRIYSIASEYRSCYVIAQNINFSKFLEDISYPAKLILAIAENREFYSSINKDNIRLMLTLPDPE